MYQYPDIPADVPVKLKKKFNETVGSDGADNGSESSVYQLFKLIPSYLRQAQINMVKLKNNHAEGQPEGRRYTTQKCTEDVQRYLHSWRGTLEQRLDEVRKQLDADFRSTYARGLQTLKAPAIHAMVSQARAGLLNAPKNPTKEQAKSLWALPPDVTRALGYKDRDLIQIFAPERLERELQSERLAVLVESLSSWVADVAALQDKYSGPGFEAWQKPAPKFFKPQPKLL